MEREEVTCASLGHDPRIEYARMVKKGASVTITIDLEKASRAQSGDKKTDQDYKGRPMTLLEATLHELVEIALDDIRYPEVLVACRYLDRPGDAAKQHMAHDDR